MMLLLKRKRGKKKKDLLLNYISSTDFYLFDLFSTFHKTFQATLQVTDPYKSPTPKMTVARKKEKKMKLPTKQKLNKLVHKSTYPNLFFYPSTLPTHISPKLETRLTNHLSTNSITYLFTHLPI